MDFGFLDAAASMGSSCFFGLVLLSSPVGPAAATTLGWAAATGTGGCVVFVKVVVVLVRVVVVIVRVVVV